MAKNKKTEFVSKEWPGPSKAWPIEKIMPYPNNTRTHPPAQVELLASMLKRWGPDQPIVVDEDGVILKGHGRRLAAIAAGLTEFPVVQRKGLPEAEKRAIRIADNQVALLAGWDQELMRFEIASLKQAGYDVALLGFGHQELVQFETAIGPPAVPGISLVERFGIVPFSVFNAREGWWQDRKRAWLALGIQSEVGRGENLIERSPQELFCHLTGIAYGKARKIVTEAMARDGDKFDLQALVKAHGGRKRKSAKANAIPGGAPMPLDRAKDARKAAAHG